MLDDLAKHVFLLSLIESLLHVRFSFAEEVLGRSGDAQLLGSGCAEYRLGFMLASQMVVLQIDDLVAFGEDVTDVAFDRARRAHRSHSSLIVRH